jgi:aspartate aminotransferase
VSRASGHLEVAANLALDEAIARRRAAGEPIVHLGFGEAGLPVLPRLGEVLAAGAARNAYGPVAGGEGARAAVAGYFARRRLPTEPEDIVLAPGSKPLLAAIVAAVPGDVVLPAPSWVTYAPQAALLGRAVHWVPIPPSAGGVPDPGRLDAALAAARRDGARPGLLVLTLPDNPTGTVAAPELVRDVCRVAGAHDLVVVADEIYRDVLFDPVAPYLSPAEVLPERTVVTTGLSKSMALGGWRIGAARFPASPLGRELRARVTGVASNVWSNLAGPMQAVTETVFAEPPDVVAWRTRATRLHAAVARAVHGILVRHEVACRPPTGGFYVYPDFEGRRARLAAAGVRDGDQLARVLLEQHGVAVMAGRHFGDVPDGLRVRAATSLLYGETDGERWAALEADDPTAVPHVAAALARLDAALDRLLGPA